MAIESVTSSSAEHSLLKLPLAGSFFEFMHRFLTLSDKKKFPIPVTSDETQKSSFNDPSVTTDNFIVSWLQRCNWWIN